MQGTRLLFAFGGLLLALALPGLAVAQSPTNDGYDNGVTVLGDEECGDAAGSSASGGDEGDDPGGDPGGDALGSSASGDPGTGDPDGDDSGDTAGASSSDASGCDPASSVATLSSGGALPFSGLDLAVIGAMGIGLGLLGVGMLRLTRKPESA
jgi:hypothetical protein